MLFFLIYEKKNRFCFKNGTKTITWADILKFFFQNSQKLFYFLVKVLFRFFNRHFSNCTKHIQNLVFYTKLIRSMYFYHKLISKCYIFTKIRNTIKTTSKVNAINRTFIFNTIIYQLGKYIITTIVSVVTVKSIKRKHFFT